MDTVLISGANRGIGLELTRQYIEKGWRVLACCRNPSSAVALTALTHDIDVLCLDVADLKSVEALAAALLHVKIDVLINNAGIMGGEASGYPEVDQDDWIKAFVVNTQAPFYLTNALVANLRFSSKPRVITVSSQMGALSRQGKGAYAYRSTKAAVNKVMQLLAQDLASRKVIVCPVHPGWVRTDMGGDDADISVEESASGIIGLTDGLTMEDSGKFFNWTGEQLEW
ncbi:MAG: NAD(P)-dependent dehydrogenase (short-subunit alcohol dehydrogenase family) [Candidatus Azotimanducaceae bacterium]|jgi:NAD(P)-dependent dehydrogenase (short-subunit alcohol dehydrogenase family)